MDCAGSLQFLHCAPRRMLTLACKPGTVPNLVTTPGHSREPSVNSQLAPVGEPGEPQGTFASNLDVYADVLSQIDLYTFEKLYGSSVSEQHAILQQFSPTQPEICNCTQGHGYRFCDRFSEHYWTWLGEGTLKGDFCSCPPTNEALLALDCARLEEHIQVCPHV